MTELLTTLQTTVLVEELSPTILETSVSRLELVSDVVESVILEVEVPGTELITGGIQIPLGSSSGSSLGTKSAAFVISLADGLVQDYVMGATVEAQLPGCTGNAGKTLIVCATQDAVGGRLPLFIAAGFEPIEWRWGASPGLLNTGLQAGQRNLYRFTYFPSFIFAEILNGRDEGIVLDGVSLYNVRGLSYAGAHPADEMYAEQRFCRRLVSTTEGTQSLVRIPVPPQSLVEFEAHVSFFKDDPDGAVEAGKFHLQGAWARTPSGNVSKLGGNSAPAEIKVAVCLEPIRAEEDVGINGDTDAQYGRIIVIPNTTETVVWVARGSYMVIPLTGHPA